ncbi:molybdenum cofactor synthesis domain [Alkaliphilus metalliredigens QYMF]|uniref:Molybdopterin molybdenumtransferase n=1 Tax=Alkaliphilus metalliredigens (strain QYMF) TaxID=293826 RepID=A6TSZ0_ALKMQ|nr:gephyrin-like molybdotransferase Glp [Alkaliphilus metalliredigens]ABR49308.1 molybdenum cofactor synthesis domain [Alkaliphilus metalliredigens QYMF]
MIELLDTVTLEEAKQIVIENFKETSLDSEKVPLFKGGGRVLATDITAPIDVPGFDRSTVDGYAVVARDTFGASESLPSFLDMIGEVEMGQGTSLHLQRGQSCYVPTGGMIPEGCDAVVMVEYTEALDEKTVGIQSSVAPRENLLKKGDDLSKGELIFKKGHRLRPQDIGVLSGIGFTEIDVYQPIRVSVISTGDEIIGPEEELKLGQIKDMNTYSLGIAAMEDGCEIVATAVVKDEIETLKNKVQELMQKSDVILISGGSSMGTKDVTKDVIDALGNPGVLFHGIAVKPGKPTIGGKISDKAIFGLPGQPVSAMVVYQTLVRPFIHFLYGLKVHMPYIEGSVAVNIPSAPGREHYVMVVIQEENGEKRVYPVHGKSGMLTTMTKAHGYICLALNQEGVSLGDAVKVYLF